MSINTITNCGLLLLKVLGILLFFLISQYMLQFIFGNLMGFFINNFWLFVLAGLIPAFIAQSKGNFFWIWWVFGAFFPIMSTIFAIGLDDSSEFKDKAKVIENVQEIVLQKNDNSKIK